MELQLISSSSSFPFLTCILIFTILMVAKTVGKKCNKSNSNLPPGPWKLPLIGNLHQMISFLPHHKLRDLSQKYGPLMHLQLGEVSTVVVSSAEMAKQVFKVHDINFSQRPLLLAAEIIFYGSTDIGFSPNGDYWKRLRKICTTELLSKARVRSFRAVREESMSELVDWISSNVPAGLPVNLSEKLHSLGYSTTARTAFGKKSKDQERFTVLAKEIVNVVTGFHVGDLFPSQKWLHVISGMKPRLERLHREADRILSDIIEDHLSKNKDVGEEEEEDLVDVLLKFVNQDHLEFSLTLDNVKAVILDMFVAGSEIAETTVVWAMVEMMKNRKILNKAQNEVRQKFNKRGRVEENGLLQLEYLQLVIKETLRFHVPGPLLVPRECGNQCKIGRFQILPKTRVIVNVWAIGRDPRYWKDPETFSPERFLYSPLDFKGNHFEYTLFGAGRRICPGMAFGITNIEYQLAMLLYHFDWKLPNNEELDMTEEFGGVLWLKNDLYLIPTHYEAPSSF